MNKQEFLSKYKFSDAEVIDPRSVFLGATETVLALSDFLNENFKGLVEVDGYSSSHERVLLSPEYLALFFKQLLADIYGRYFLKISIKCDTELMSIHIPHDDSLPLSFEERCKIIKTARNAGFEVYKDENGMLLTVQYADRKTYYVYAVPSNASRIVKYKLGEIFFCGRPMVLEPSSRARKPLKRKKEK